MKNLIYIKFILLLLFASACSDYLEEENKTSTFVDDYFRTAEGYESLINANYASLRDIYGDDAAALFTLGTDLFTFGRDDDYRALANYRDLTPTEANGGEAVLSFYRDLYEAIQLANNALFFNEITEEAETLSVREGEIRFLRAYYYFLLVQTFGDVPVVMDRIQEPILEFERVPEEEVYQLIVEEMEMALGLVPEEADQFGRVDKRVIRHYLAKVHLTRGYQPYAASDDFDVAAAYADAAINGQGLTLSFEELFYPGNEENEEILFSVQYDAASIIDPADDGNTQNFWFGPYFGGEGTKYGYPYRSYDIVPSQHAFEVFAQTGEKDARWEATFMVEYYEPHPSTEGASGSTVGYYRYYTEASSRETIPVKIFFAHEWIDQAAWRAENPATRTDTEIRPFGPEWEASSSTAFDAATPAVKKFDDPAAVFSADGGSTRDIFLARLGETYLIAAEAYFKAGDPGTAADRINEVRRRAAEPGMEVEMEIDAGDVSIDFILEERARELLGEYKRWFDLKRTGTLVERNLLYNTPVKNLGANPFTEGKLLRPIPQAVIDNNEALGPEDQNPGY